MNTLSKQLITNKTIFIFSTIVIFGLLVLSVDDDIFKPIPADTTTTTESNTIVLPDIMKFFDGNLVAICLIVIIPLFMIAVIVILKNRVYESYDDDDDL